ECCCWLRVSCLATASLSSGHIACSSPESAVSLVVATCSSLAASCPISFSLIFPHIGGRLHHRIWCQKRCWQKHLRILELSRIQVVHGPAVLSFQSDEATTTIASTSSLLLGEAWCAA